MKRVSCHLGQLQIERDDTASAGNGEQFTSGFDAWDRLAPGGGFARGAIHELLFETTPGGRQRGLPPAQPRFVAMLLAKAALLRPGSAGAVAWCDPGGVLYPPALAAGGISLRQLLLLRPGPKEVIPALAECMACRGICATVAGVERLSRIDARRLQLAAERGGGVGLLLRPDVAGAQYAAATRWRVRPARGERTVQRWEVELVHGHGGRVGQSVILEACRETHSVRAFEAVADRPAHPATQIRRA